jgi:hypothetical protein
VRWGTAAAPVLVALVAATLLGLTRMRRVVVA